MVCVDIMATLEYSHGQSDLYIFLLDLVIILIVKKNEVQLEG